MAGSATTFEENLALAQSAMARYADAPLPHLIAGQRVLSRSGEWFVNVSPDLLSTRRPAIRCGNGASA